MGLRRCFLVVVVLLAVGCGDDDDCPAGLTRVGGRCVDPGDGDADADGDGDGDGDADCGDGGPLEVWTDADGDGYGADGTEEFSCDASPGQATQGGDCDDSDAFAHPDAAERCNAEDDDCDGAPDDGLGCVAGAVSACETECGSQGEQTCSEACIPSACAIPEETCNHVDDDCDGLVDEDLQGWIGDPVQLTDDETRAEWLPVVGWTGQDVVVGWYSAAVEGDPDRSLVIGTFTPEGVPVTAPFEVVELDLRPEAAALGVLGGLALFGYAVEPTDGQAEPVVRITPLDGLGGPVPVPLGTFGDMEAFSHFEVLPMANGMLVSMLTPFQLPNELHLATWSLDPIGETHSVSFPNLPFADVALEAAGTVLVAWPAAGEILVGRYDAALGELDAPRIVTASGGLAMGAHVVAVGDGALVVYSGEALPLFALPLAADLTPGDAVEIGSGFFSPDGVVSSGSDVVAITTDFDTDTHRFVRIGPDGQPADGPVDLAPQADRFGLRIAWAGDRWAVVWYSPFDGMTPGDLFLHTYGCLPDP